MTDPTRIRIHGPLTIYVEFAGRLATQGYSERVLVAQLRLMAHVSRWLEAQHLSAEQLTPERRAAFAAHRRAAGYRSGGSRSLFRLACAPFGPMTMTGVRAVLRRACWRVGLRDTGAHPFRHTLATDILARGGSLAEIGQLLRHTDLATTAIYAKVDHNALGAVALPWPGGAA